MVDASSVLPGKADRTPLSEAGAVLELREILRIVGERYRIILLVTFLGLVLGIGASLLTTPRFRASVLLQYDPQANDALEQSRSPLLRPMVANQEMLATQMGLLKSEALAMRVAQDLDLAGNPNFGGKSGSRDERLKRAAAVVQGGIEVEAVKNSLLLRVSYSSPDPAMAAQVATALGQTFITTNIERRYASGAYARRFLSEQLGRTKTALEQSERAVNDYAIRTGLFRAPGQLVDGKASESVTLTVTDLAAMEEALNQARIRRVTAQSAWSNGASDQPADKTAVNTLTQQKAQISAQYAQNLKTFKPDYPAMQELAAQMAHLDSEIARERARGKGDDTARLKAAYRAALQAESDLTARVAAAKNEVQGERGRSIQYTILQREADTNRAQYDALLQRLKEVTTASGIQQSNIALVDDAKVPPAPYRPRIVFNAMIGLGFGLLAGLVAAFAMHLLFDVVVLPEDARGKLGLKVLGIIPRAADNLPLSVLLADRHSSVSEAYYSMLTALKFARSEGMPRTLCITSSNASEGKSTTSYAIAVMSARLGHNVLLIDADLRRPTFVSEDARWAPGLGHLLSSDDPLSRCARSTAQERLSLLPVGELSGSPAELLSSVRLPSLIAEAAATYDLVVIDGPPVLGLTDAPLLASVAEATVVVIESGKTRTGNAHDMVRRVREAGGLVLGAVLTKVSGKSAGYGYDYQYHYTGSEAGSKAHIDLDAKPDVAKTDVVKTDGFAAVIQGSRDPRSGSPEADRELA